MPLVILVAGLVFLALHVVLWRTREPDYERAFKMARGVAALTLTAVGFAGLIGALPHWNVGFLYEHAASGWMIVGVSIAYGHLLADFVSMAYGRFVLGKPQRVDLIAHHGLGLLAYGVSMHLGLGHALVLISLASEIMPCCTGLEAWGRHLARPQWEVFAAKLRLRVLVAWRLPLWAAVVTLLVRAVALDTLAPELRAVAWFVLACLAILIGLDVYWVRKCVDAARRRQAKLEAAGVLPR